MESTYGGVDAFAVYDGRRSENNGSEGGDRGEGVRVWRATVSFPFSAARILTFHAPFTTNHDKAPFLHSVLWIMK